MALCSPPAQASSHLPVGHQMQSISNPKSLWKRTRQPATSANNTPGVCVRLRSHSQCLLSHAHPHKEPGPPLLLYIVGARRCTPPKIHVPHLKPSPVMHARRAPQTCAALAPPSARAAPTVTPKVDLTQTATAQTADPEKSTHPCHCSGSPRSRVPATCRTVRRAIRQRAVPAGMLK